MTQDRWLREETSARGRGAHALWLTLMLGLFLALEQDTLLKASLLGAALDTEIDVTYHLEPDGDRYSYLASDRRRGSERFTLKISVEQSRLLFDSWLTRRELNIPLDEDVLLENPLFYPHLKADFADRDLAEETYRVFEIVDARVQKITCRRVEYETLELLGRPWEAVVLDRLNRVTGSKARLWIDLERGLLLQSRHPNGRFYYLTAAAPPELIPYLGTYHLAKAQLDFEVIYHQGALALRQAGTGGAIRLEPADEKGSWVDEHGRHLRFETGETGEVAQLNMESITPFERSPESLGA